MNSILKEATDNDENNNDNCENLIPQRRSLSRALYVDRLGIPCPLGRCYIATGSRDLSSGLMKCFGEGGRRKDWFLDDPRSSSRCDSPDENSILYSVSSTTVEAESAHCIQCLSFWDATTASSNGGTCAVGCVSCPTCGIPLSIALEIDDVENDNDAKSSNKGVTTITRYRCVYQCGYCLWNSHEQCGVSASVQQRREDESDKSITSDNTAAVSDAATRLMIALKIERQRRDGPSDKFMKDLVKTWGGLMKDGAAAKRMGGRMSLAEDDDVAKNDNDDGVRGAAFGGSWGVDRLEDSILKKRHRYKLDAIESILPLPSFSPSSSSSSFSSHPKQQTSPPSSSLLPASLQLRASGTRRCRAELRLKRPGILVRDKANPLEGDTSLRHGHGQWWKKDSSAIHAVPLVCVRGVVRLDIGGGGDEGVNSCDDKAGDVTDDNGIVRYILLLLVRNPTLGPVSLSMGPLPVATKKEEGPVYLQDVILNSVSGETGNISLVAPPPSSSASPSSLFSEEIHLGPAEDALLRVGDGRSGSISGNNDSPPAIETWGVEESGRDINTNVMENLSVRIVAASGGDRAWVRFVVDVPRSDDNVITKKAGQRLLLTSPMIMKINVGDGSWESALVQSGSGSSEGVGTGDVKKDNEGGKDVVTFTILPLWET